MKSKNYLFAAALAIATVSPMAYANENCETGMQVAGVDGSTISIKDSKRTFTVNEENAANVQGWGADNYLRFCDGDKLTNISFRTLPTYTVTVNEGVHVPAVAVPVAEVEQNVSVTPIDTPAPAPADTKAQ